MPLRPCLDCGRLSPDRRCPTHRAAHQQAKDARRPQRRTAAETRRRRQAVDDHVAAYGWWCPGAPDLDHPPHPSTDLTADHIHQVADGGPEAGPLRVLCRSKNSQRGATCPPRP